MQLTTCPTENALAETQLHEDEITGYYWRIWRGDRIDHFEILLSLWVGGHRIVAQLQIHVQTTLALSIDGGTITFEASEVSLGCAFGETSNYLGRICLIDNDAAGIW